MSILTLRSTFPIFPDGMPGIGLLLLRAVVGLTLLSFGIVHFVVGQEAKAFPLIMATLSSIIGLLLLVGLFNWLACSFGALISLGGAIGLVPVPVPFPNAILVKVCGVFMVVVTVALLCLGPGAYSLDARRHGRREIIIPARPRSSDDTPL